MFTFFRKIYFKILFIVIVFLMLVQRICRVLIRKSSLLFNPIVIKGTLKFLVRHYKGSRVQ